MKMKIDDERSEGGRTAKNPPYLQYCDSGDVRLAVYCQGDPSKPNIVLVHGYPDDSQVWDLLVNQLADQFYIIRYDVRGAGNSTTPANRSDYLLAYLKADLQAVTTKFCSRTRFHLVGHDWGSVQSWESVTCPTFREKILSYTSISGPCLDHVGHWFRRRWRESGGPRSVIQQIFQSWYIWLFKLPFLAPLLWRTVLGRHWLRIMRALESINTQHVTLAQGVHRQRDGINGIELYRANCLRYFRSPRERISNRPVQLVIPTRDRFLNADLYSETAAWVSNIVIHRIDGGHWLPLSHPHILATLIGDFVTKTEP
ncbi:alpha/beta fold hydrolase [Zhongshania sp. BJYM1]|uniref:alpha/beta fold hydrolase n=1 Tax=Zhongshania aquatica TaxID=2965069 RepID=UPI0022B4E522|nr:alpha/beta fold hydrolase [Marortus sp. BJYM1]